jgi:hypothetical protein
VHLKSVRHFQGHEDIDGIVAAIMAVGVMMEGGEPEQEASLEWV